MSTPRIPRSPRAVRRVFTCTLGLALVLALTMTPAAFAETPAETATAPTAETATAEASTATPEASPTGEVPPRTETLKEELERLRAQLFGSGVVETSGGCAARADCDDGTTISCVTTTGDSGSCDWQDQDCDGGSLQGWVTCGFEEVHCEPCSCEAPPISKCMSEHPCEQGCGQCGPGTCIGGRCNCLA